MLEIFHHHHPHNKRPSLNPKRKQSLYPALLVLNLGFMDNWNIIHVQYLSLSFIECQQCYSYRNYKRWKANWGSFVTQSPWNTYFQRVVVGFATQCFLSYHTCHIDWLAELKLAALLHSYLVFKTTDDSYDLFYSTDIISKSTYSTVDILFGEKWVFFFVFFFWWLTSIKKSFIKCYHLGWEFMPMRWIIIGNACLFSIFPFNKRNSCS